MDILFVTVPVTLIFIAVAVWIFFWATKNGQYDDMDSPANRILFDDDQRTQPQQGDVHVNNITEGDTTGGEDGG